MTIQGGCLVLDGIEAAQPFLERTKLWVHENPVTAKVVLVAGFVFGAALFSCSIVAASSLGAVITVSLAVTGALLKVAAAVALYVIDILAPPHHDMKDHLFKEGECADGKLFYEGDVPILSLEAGDPYDVGKAHGYLCGDAISCITKRFNLVLHTVAGKPKASELPALMQALKEVIPQKYLREVEGIVAGYNTWAQEQSWWNRVAKLTVDDLLLFHMMPDSIH